jgi:hypothetical protein
MTGFGFAQIPGQLTFSFDLELELKLVQNLDLDLRVEKTSIGALVSVRISEIEVGSGALHFGI